MNDPKEQQEPSMEEILASIRRIISEDDEGEEGGEEAVAGEEAPAGEAPEEASADDIDALMADAGPASNDDDVLELTEEIQDDGTVVDLDAGVDDTGEEVEIVAVEIEEPAPETQPDTIASVTEGLVASPIAAEATSTFAGLATAVEQGRLASSQGIGGRTVEDVVKEVIRPIVKDWLDENLAGLVERLVSREIDRMSRRAKDQVPD